MPETQQDRGSTPEPEPGPSRDISKLLRRLRETGRPVVLTINGEASLVVDDSGSYERLLEIAERAERMEALGEAVAEMKAGKGRPIEEMFAEMERILAERAHR
ncbi:MAG: prevent-host-death protein [Isosphaeraceae bacterium]